MIYCYHYQVEFQKRGNKFCREIKNYQVESFEPDSENDLNIREYSNINGI